MTKFNAKYEIYGYLQEIKGVKFTSREVDVISCILHNRGEKKIANLLSISHKTVGSHVHNIMNKIGKSNRNYVIDFIESSGKLELFKQYYLHLLLYNSFEKALSKIGNLNKKQEKYYWILDEELFKELSSQLELANIILTDNKQDVESGKELKLEKDGDYYLNVLNIVRDIKGNAAIDGIIHDFKKERAALEKSLKTLRQNTIRIWVNKNKIWLWSVFIIVVLLMTVVCVRYYRQYQALLSLDAFLQSKDQFSDVNIKQESAYKNYEIPGMEKIIVALDEKRLNQYFSEKQKSIFIKYLYHLHTLSSYYMYYEHNGDKSREVLNLAFRLISSQFDIDLKLDGNPEEIYQELNVVKDLPEIYTRLLYSMGRSYLYNNEDFIMAKKYFMLSKYLGNKLDLFEGYLSETRGLALITWFEIKDKMISKNYDFAKKLALDAVKLYHNSINKDRAYFASYIPGQSNDKTAILKGDVHNNIDCRKRMMWFYVKLLEIDRLTKTHQDEQYLSKISSQILDSDGILSKINELSDKKQADMYNFLGNLLLKLDNMRLPSNITNNFISAISKKLGSNTTNDIDLIISLFNIALSKSRDTYFTKADAYDGLFRAYGKTGQPNDKYRIERDRINKNLNRVSPDIFE